VHREVASAKPRHNPNVGASVGLAVGLAEGDAVGLVDGDTVGLAVGDEVGEVVGESVGDFVGEDVGLVVGDAVGLVVGEVVGLVVGDCVGLVVGVVVGLVVGDVVGDCTPIATKMPPPYRTLQHATIASPGINNRWKYSTFVSTVPGASGVPFVSCVRKIVYGVPPVPRTPIDVHSDPGVLAPATPTTEHGITTAKSSRSSVVRLGK
jgi:hypothetical protein